VKLRDEFRNRVGEAHLAFFEQHQDRYTGNRFRHGSNPEETVLRHGLPGIEVCEPVRFELNDPAATRDQRYRSSDIVRVDVSLYCLLNSCEPLRRKADLFRFDALDRCRRQRAHEQGQNGSDKPKLFHERSS
jgi:hypothetical protein